MAAAREGAPVKPRSLSWRTQSALGTTALLVVFGVYALCLQAVLLHDDVIIVHWLGDRNLQTIFESRPGDGLYRPLSYLPWVLTRELFGGYPGPIMHLQNLAAHLLNAALVFALVKRLQSACGAARGIGPLLALLIFGLFPFSYQAVLWASALVHPLALLFGLLAAHAYLYPELPAARGRPAVWRGLSAACILAACLSHEAGFVAGGFVFLTELLLAAQRRRRVRLSAVLLLGLGLAYPLLYKFVISSGWAKVGSTLPDFTPASLFQSLTYFMQGAIGWLIALLRGWLGLGPERYALITGLFAVCAGLGIAVLLRSRLLLVGLYGLAWLGGSALVMSIFLPEAYLAQGPRLLYISSAGVAIFWGAVLQRLAEILAGRAARQRAPRALRWMAGALLAGLVAYALLWTVPFIGRRLEAVAQLSRAGRSIAADMRSSKPGAGFLILGQPEWSNGALPPFLQGADGMPLTAQYSPPWAWYAAINGAVREVAFARNELREVEGGGFVYGLLGDEYAPAAIKERVLAGDTLYRYQFDRPAVRALRLGAIEPGSAAAGAYLARISNTPSEQAILSRGEAVQCGDLLRLRLTWADAQGLRDPLTIFTHAYGADGRRLAAADADLVGGYLPLNELPAGAQVEEVRELRLADATPVKEVRLGAYIPGTGQRIRDWKPDGSEWPNNEVSVPLRPENCALDW